MTKIDFLLYDIGYTLILLFYPAIPFCESTELIDFKLEKISWVIF